MITQRRVRATDTPPDTEMPILQPAPPFSTFVPLFCIPLTPYCDLQSFPSPLQYLVSPFPSSRPSIPVFSTSLYSFFLFFPTPRLHIHFPFTPSFLSSLRLLCSSLHPSSFLQYLPSLLIPSSSLSLPSLSPLFLPSPLQYLPHPNSFLQSFPSPLYPFLLVLPTDVPETRD